jgi:VanZ family protein
LLPAEDMVRTGSPGELEHFVAYAGSGAVAMAAYGLRRGAIPVIGLLSLYAGVLEYIQHFSPGRHPSLVDFATSAAGALCGGVAIVVLWRWYSPVPSRGGAA